MRAKGEGHVSETRVRHEDKTQSGLT